MREMISRSIMERKSNKKNIKKPHHETINTFMKKKRNVCWWMISIEMRNITTAHEDPVDRTSKVNILCDNLHSP